MQINAYIILLIATGLASASLGVYILRRRRTRGSTELAFLLLAIAEWSLAQSLEAAATDRTHRIFWAVVAYPGTTAAPVLILLYALRHANLDRWLTRRRALCVFIVPLISTVLAATNEWHGLLWSEVTLSTGLGGVTALYARGPWYWVQVSYSYLAVSLGFVIVLWTVIVLPHLYSLQSRLLIVASTAPLAGSALYILAPGAFDGLDPIPPTFALSAALLALSIFRYRLLDLIPLARESLFDSMQDGVLFLDTQLRVVDLNRAAQQMLSLSLATVGQPIEEALASWPRLVAFLQVEGEAWTELSHDTPDQRYLAVHRSPLSDRHQQAAGQLVIVRDITQRKRAEEERLEMERRLLHGQKLESLGVLTGGIAHDFNNLLTAMLGNMELALLDLPPESPARTSIVQGIRSVRRAADLVRQMLAYSGKGSFVVTGVQLSEQIEAMEDLLRTSIGRNVTLELDLAHDLPITLADPGQVEQVVMNLAINASEAIGERPGVIRLSTGVQECDEACLAASRLAEKPPAGRFVYVEVSDTGCGMDEEVQQRLFEPFFTTKFTGRGLGLSAMLGIVRTHQGAILLQSDLGKGTTIRVLLPIATGHSSPHPAMQPPYMVAAVPLLSGTALIVDDEEPVRSLARSMVERCGLCALTAADGEEAINLLREHVEEISCIILDMTMPHMDGIATYQELVRIRPGIPVIMTSGHSPEHTSHRLAGQPSARFLQKPFQFESLCSLLQSMLNSHPQPEA